MALSCRWIFGLPTLLLISIWPSKIDTPEVEPFPSILTLPVPEGLILISALDTETIALPFTSKLPPSCGLASETILENSDGLNVSNPFAGF